MSANNSASLSSVVVVGDLFRVTLPGESAFRSHKVTKKVEEGKRGGRRRRGNENTRRVPSLRGSMLVVVSDRRTVNEARVGFLSRREDNVLRGGRERRKGKERERERRKEKAFRYCHRVEFGRKFKAREMFSGRDSPVFCTD